MKSHSLEVQFGLFYVHTSEEMCLVYGHFSLAGGC